MPRGFGTGRLGSVAPVSPRGARGGGEEPAAALGHASGTRAAAPELLAGSGLVEQNIERQRTKIMAGAVVSLSIVSNSKIK